MFECIKCIFIAFQRFFQILRNTLTHQTVVNSSQQTFSLLIERVGLYVSLLKKVGMREQEALKGSGNVRL